MRAMRGNIPQRGGGGVVNSLELTVGRPRRQQSARGRKNATFLKEQAKWQKEDRVTTKC